MDHQNVADEFKVRISILRKMLLYVTLLIVIAVCISTYVAVKIESRVLKEGLIYRAKRKVRDIAFSTESAFWSFNWLFLEKMLKESIQGEVSEIVYSKIVKPNGEVYLASDRAYYGENIDSSLLLRRETLLDRYFFSEREQHGMLLVYPITIQKEVWHIILGLSLEPVKGALKGLVYHNMAWACLIVLLGISGSFFLSKSISQPIIKLASAARIISSGNWDHNVIVKSKDEVGLLTHSFNRMIKNLKRTEEELQKAHDELERRVAERTAELANANQVLQAEIAERKTAEEALRESEEKYRNLVERANDGIAIIQDERIRFINKRLADIVGYSTEEIANTLFTRYVHPEEVPVLLERYRKRMNNEAIPQRYETIMRHRNGADIRAELNAGITTYGGRIADLIFVRDITDQKKIEEERRKLGAQLQRAEKMEAIGTLAGGVAHDLNNILSGLVSYPELLLMELPDDSHLRKPIETIQRSGEKAAAIVQDLLTLARRGVSVKELVDLNHIISEYMKSPEFKKLVSFHPDVRIETDLKADLLPIIGSPVHLSKTVMNLVSNAAEAMPEGGTISISTQNCYIDRPVRGYDGVEEGDYATLTISDPGVGISHQDLDRIFEPFYTKKVMGRSGTGLGMAVVWGTVKDHKGYIDVQSNEGRGTTFTLYFPVTSEKLVKDNYLISIDDIRGNQESILVVDDVEEQREIASSILNKLGYSVTAVSSGEEAVRFLEENSVDLVLLDMIMDPGIDGLETYRRILEMHPKQKAIIASGFSETERVKEAQRLGAGAYVKKPFLLEKIGRAVKNELDG